MNILQIISGVHVNGALTHCLLLTRQLAERGHQVTVMCRRQSWIWKRLEDLPVRRIACDMKRRYSDLSFARKFVRENRIDVCHTHMSRAHFFGVLLRKISGVPCVATAHACHLQLHWPYNDFVIANSEDTRRYQHRYNRVSNDRLKTIYCFTDLKKFLATGKEERKEIRDSLKIKSGEFLMGIVGDVIARKGHRELFQKLPALFQRHPELRLAVIGRFERERPYVRKLRRFVLQHGLASKIIWTGRSDRVQDHMAALDLCVVPSISEPLGLVAMEAMAASTPVVAARVGGLPEIITHEDNGLLIDTRKKEDLESAVSRMIQDTALRESFVRNGLESVTRKFSPETLTLDIEAVLQRVAGKTLAAVEPAIAAA